MDTHSSKKTVWIALLANFLIFAIKAGGAWLSGSAAMFSEALHSMADMFNSIFLLIGLHLSLKPIDEDHPFGHGREIFFWSFVASVFMLGVTSAGSIYKGIQSLIEPRPIDDFSWTLVALCFSFIFEAYAVCVALKGIIRDVGLTAKGIVIIPVGLRNLKKVSNPAIKFIFFEDGIALLGVTLATIALVLVQVTGFEVFDGCVSILIGTILGAMALMLAKENRDMIIGQAAPDALEQAIGDTAMSIENVEDVTELKTMYVGPQDLLVNMEIEIPPETTVEKMDDIIEDVEEKIRKEIPSVKHISIEVSPDDEVQDWPKVNYKAT